MYGFYTAVIAYGVTEMFRYLVFVYANYRISIRGLNLDIFVTIIVSFSLILVEYIIWFMESLGHQEQSLRFVTCFIVLIISAVTGFSYFKYQLKER